MFEIVAEAEVAQHFEEGVMTRGVTDVFQIIVFTACTNATLCSGSAGIITFVEPKEYVLELVHPGVGKQQKSGRYSAPGSCWQLPDVPCYGKIEKRLTDLSGALAHNYPEIKLTKCGNWSPLFA